MSNFKVSGEVLIKKNDIVVYKSMNAIQQYFLDFLAGRLASDTDAGDYMGGVEGLYNTGVIGGGATNDIGWKVVDVAGAGDGIIISADLTAGAVHYGIDTVVHPTDPSGWNYRRWQGQMTAGTIWTGIGPVIVEAALGTGFNQAAALGGGNIWSSRLAISPAISLADADILTVEWKIVVVGQT